MNQRWLWNFPEGPCSPCRSLSDCQSLTSTAAAIGWRASRVEHYWLAELCHTDQCAGSPRPFKMHFCCNADISPCIRWFIFLQFSLPSLIMTVYTRGGLKKALREVISVVVMYNSMTVLFHVCCPVYRLRTFAQKEAQGICWQRRNLMHRSLSI